MMNNSNTFVRKIRVEHSDDLTSLLESICQENNINNYFGTISVAVSQTLEIINSVSDRRIKVIEFSFEQCIGGISITIRSEGKAFEKFDTSDNQPSDFKNVSSYIINNLADRVSVSEQGDALEMDFLVNGIEPELLSSRREKIKQYFKNTSLHHSTK